MSPTSFQALREEYGRERLGNAIYQHVRRVVRLTARHYPPSVYAETFGGDGGWTDEDLDDLAQEFVLDVLLDETDPQLDAIMGLATSTGEIDALLRRQLRRHLGRRRRRTAIDNLMDRARTRLAAPPFVELPGTRYGLSSGDAGQPMSEADHREAAVLVARLPRRAENPVERAPRVFEAETLLEALLLSARCWGRPFGLDDIRSVFDLALTDLSLAFLLPHHEPAAEPRRGGPMMATPALAPDEQTLVEVCAEQMLALLDDERRVILRLRGSGATDQALADELGVSRPTAIKRRNAAIAELAGPLADLDEELQLPALEALMDRLRAEVADG